MESFWKRTDDAYLTFASNGGYDVFVETGTQASRTTLNAAATFFLVRTVDISPEATARAATLFRDQPGVETYTGDSGKVIWKMIDDLEDYKVMFWLDAHVTSREDAEAAKAAGRGQCPLLEEIKAIAHYDWTHTPLILIDDAPCFGAKEPMFGGQVPGEWPGLVEIIFILGPRWRVSVEGQVIVCQPV